jgi:hypothetical protein
MIRAGLAFADVCVGDQQRVAHTAEDLLHSGDYRTEQRVLDVWDDHADRHRPVGSQTLGERVGAVPEPGGGFEDSLHRVTVHYRTSLGIERAGGSRDVNVRLLGDVPKCHPFRHVCLGPWSRFLSLLPRRPPSQEADPLATEPAGICYKRLHAWRGLIGPPTHREL